MRFCSVEGCQRRAKSRGWCNTHYERWRRGGSVDVHPERVCELGGCDRKHYGRGLCRMHWERWRRHGDALAAPRRWMTDSPRYSAVHYRLKATRGQASAQRCADCGSAASEWSYDGGCPNEMTEISRTGLTVPYSVDLDRYQARCVPCHRKKDSKTAHGKVPWSVETVAA